MNSQRWVEVSLLVKIFFLCSIHSDQCLCEGRTTRKCYQTTVGSEQGHLPSHVSSHGPALTYPSYLFRSASQRELNATTQSNTTTRRMLLNLHRSILFFPEPPGCCRHLVHQLKNCMVFGRLTLRGKERGANFLFTNRCCPINLYFHILRCFKIEITFCLNQ